jgi:hypothetical protein
MKMLVLGFAAVHLAAMTLHAAEPTVTMDYSNPGLSPAHWVLTISPSGSGHFRSERGNVPPGPATGVEAGDVDRDITVSADFAARTFAVAREEQFFNIGCESHMKVAFQGSRTLSYDGADGKGSCTYNFSKLKEIQALGESLVAVGGSIIEGARLDALLQHDRLGLDKEMEYLAEAAGDGRVQQIGTIREILQRLADDPQVMDRVRKRARVLLARTN